MSVDSLQAFRDIYKELPSVAVSRGRVTESDTRAKLLDRVIRDVLRWPDTAVDREPFANPGFVDYLFTTGRPLMLWEAKAAGETFVFPYSKTRVRHQKLNGALLTDKTIADAIHQAQRYAADTGTRFAVATNGYSWIIFRAIVEGTAWKNGSAIVFRDYNDVESNFTEFLNLLSYESVQDGKLEQAFRVSPLSSRHYYRVAEELVDADATYGRNSLSIFLKPYIDKFFGDIAIQDNTDVLQKCYVYSKPIQIIDEQLNLVLSDEVPTFAAGSEQVFTYDGDQGGAIGKALASASSGRGSKGTVILLMGGIGSGKSTFCRRFFRVVSPSLVSEHGKALLVYLDFLGAPDQPSQLESHLWKLTSTSLKQAEPSLQTRDSLLKLFDSEVRITREIYSFDSGLNGRINDILFKNFEDDQRFGERALSHCAKASRIPIVVFDNADQLRPEAQTQLFTTAQRFANMFECISFIVLREESYASAILKKHLTASTIRPYHLSSPRFKKVLSTRIQLAIDAAKANAQKADATDAQKEYADIVQLFLLLDKSVFGHNRHIIYLVESIAYGNTRLALNLFNTFITSGATNIAKILEYYSTRGGYTVPFHEFAKSIILGDYRYYIQSRSLISNLFDVSRAPNASHFTALRILSLLTNVQTSRSGGYDFVRLGTVLTSLVDVFANEDDCLQTMLRLAAVDRQLLEFDTRRPDSLDGVSAVRITTSGVYYLNFFVNSFAYMDLMWHDTPFDDRGIADELTKVVLETDLYERFSRVNKFITYLEANEAKELFERNVGPDDKAFGPFMPRIRRHVENEINRIERKIPEAYRRKDWTSASPLH